MLCKMCALKVNLPWEFHILQDMISKCKVNILEEDETPIMKMNLPWEGDMRSR